MASVGTGLTPAGEEGREAFAASATHMGLGPYPPRALAVMGAFAPGQ